METNHKIPVYQQVITEQNQGHETRQALFTEVEKLLGVPVITFFTSFYHPVMIEDGDAAMIEGLLQKIDTSKGLALMINSPGGIGISAERIINICNSYSGTGNFFAIVPGKAKSAATMVCMGASKIFMSKTSELGPIDPQIQIQKDNKNSSFMFSLCNVVSSYKELFNQAVNTTGNLQPFLQQLANYDHREIKEFETAISLAEDLAIRALGNGMLKGKTYKEIKEQIKIFLTPEKTKSHGRSIFFDDAQKCGLIIDLMELESPLWKNLYELFIRTENYTNTKVSKCIESRELSFGIAI